MAKKTQPEEVQANAKPITSLEDLPEHLRAQLEADIVKKLQAEGHTRGIPVEQPPLELSKIRLRGLECVNPKDNTNITIRTMVEIPIAMRNPETNELKAAGSFNSLSWLFHVSVPSSRYRKTTSKPKVIGLSLPRHSTPNQNQRQRFNNTFQTVYLNNFEEREEKLSFSNSRNASKVTSFQRACQLAFEDWLNSDHEVDGKTITGLDLIMLRYEQSQNGERIRARLENEEGMIEFDLGEMLQCVNTEEPEPENDIVAAARSTMQA